MAAKRKTDDMQVIKVMVSMTKAEKKRYLAFCEKKGRLALSAMIRQAMEDKIAREGT
jgi:hypothetical protein